MTSKNIVFIQVEKAELLEQPVWAPKAGEVTVKLAVSSISSGTERANLMGSLRVSVAGDQTEAIFPRYGGYSSAGTVVQVGPDVTDFKVGDRVALSWSRHSQYITLPAKNLCPIGELDFADAALFHIGIFPLAAIRKCRLELGESAIVMGLGVLGLLGVSLLRAAGAAPVIAVDPIAQKRQKALQCGADYALDPYDPDFAQQVKELTGGGARVGIEVTGVGKGLDGILDCMAPFGRVALLGCTRDSDFSIDYYHKVHGPGITLIGAHTKARPNEESFAGWWTQKDDMAALAGLTKAGRISFGALVDEVHSPAEAPEIYDRLARESTFPIVQFDWGRLE